MRLTEEIEAIELRMVEPDAQPTPWPAIVALFCLGTLTGASVVLWALSLMGWWS
jgi:hypothetical protein